MRVTGDRNIRHLNAAQGFADLGMYVDANAELEAIAPEMRDGTEVLELRTKIYCALGRWELMHVTASALVRRHPENVTAVIALSTAARYLWSPEAARTVLLQAVERVPQAAELHYALARYECQIGAIEAGRAHLAHAIKLDANSRLRALDDEDLQSIWNFNS